VIGYTVLVAGVLVLANWLIQTYRVHGPVYQQIEDDLHLQNNLDPATMNLGVCFLLLQELDTTTDPTEAQDVLRRFREAEAKYLDQRAYWTSRLPDGEIRRAITEQASPPANEVLKLVNEKYLKLALSKDPKYREEARRVLQNEIRPWFYA